MYFSKQFHCLVPLAYLEKQLNEFSVSLACI